jgi:hypothetical protein
MSSVSLSGNALCLGNSNVSMEIIDTTVNDVLSTYAPVYQKIVADKRENLEKNPEHYKDLNKSGLPGKYFPNGYVLIPEDLIHDKSGEERYYINLAYEIADLKTDTPITKLALSLHQMVCKFGFESNSVGIRLEKGCFCSYPDYWHLDGVKLGHSITICWSNQPNVLREETETDKKIEAVAQAAQFGYFYNARKVFHRGPRVEDLGDEKLGVNDYRLFIRFIKK